MAQDDDRALAAQLQAGLVVIETTILSRITHVRLYEETIAHVKAEHREVPAELLSIIGSVARAVKRPSHVEASYRNSVVFVDDRTTNAQGHPLRVPVRIVSETSGLVKTFFFAPTPTRADVIHRRYADRE